MALDQINQVIMDMEEAEAFAAEQGYLPGQYNLAALTKQQTKKRIEKERNKNLGIDYNKSKQENIQARAEWLAKETPGDFSPEDMMGKASEQINRSWSGEYAKEVEEVIQEAADLNARLETYPIVKTPTDEDEFLLGVDDASNVFAVDGKEYSMLEYTDEAANQVLFDEKGNISQNSPVRVIGTDENNKPVLAAEKDYKGKGIVPFKPGINVTSPNPKAQLRTVNYSIPTVPDLGEEDKYLKLMKNHVKPFYKSINELDDANGIDMIRNLQEKGVLRTTLEMQNKTEPVTQDTAPVTEEEKKARLAYAQRDKTPKPVYGK